jgi:hypothetical protein
VRLAQDLDDVASPGLQPSGADPATARQRLITCAALLDADQPAQQVLVSGVAASANASMMARISAIVRT